MSLKVTLNTNAGVAAGATAIVSSRMVGTILDPGLAFWDPNTSTNLNPSNPTSADLSSYTASQMINIVNAVKCGVLTVTTGSLAASAEALAHDYAMYSSFASAGSAGTTYLGSGSASQGGPWSIYGITGVAARDSNENNW